MRLLNGLLLVPVVVACSSDDKTPDASASQSGSGGGSSLGVSGAPSAGAPTQPTSGSGGNAASSGGAAASQSGAAGALAGASQAGALSQGGSGPGGASSGSGGRGGSSGGAATPGEGGGGASAAAGAAGSAGGGAPNPGALILSDNFDGTVAAGPPDPAKWEAYEAWASSFAPTVDGSKAHSPPNSLRVTSTNTGLGSFLVPKSGFPVAGNSFYVRVYINWEKASSAIMGHSGFLVGATARDNSGTELRLGISNKGPGDQAMLDLNLIGGSGGEVTRYSNGFTDGGDPGKASGNGFQFSADTWVCLEAFFNGGAHEFRVWADGAEIEAMHVTDFQGSPGGTPRTTWAPSYSVLKIGAQDYDANLGKIWYDDVVVSKERVGCQ